MTPPKTTTTDRGEAMTTTTTAVVPVQGAGASIREAAALAMRGADESERRAGTVPAAVRRLAPSTCRLRGCAFRRFADWLDGPGAGSPSLGAAADAYAEHLFAAGRSVSTAATDLGAVRWWAKAAGVEGAGDLGRDAISDARRDGDRRRRGRGQAGAITWRDADRISRRAVKDGSPKGLRDAALVAVASDLCARVSEAAALRVRDVTAAGDGSGTVEVYQAKTGKTRTGYLRASTVRRLDAWRAAGDVDGADAPLFPSMDRWGRVKRPARAMEPRAIADVIRKRAAEAGIRATGHSLRVGAAVSMAGRGASLVAMQQAGGWTAPDMPAHYGRQASVRKGPVATLRSEDRWA